MLRKPIKWKQPLQSKYLQMKVFLFCPLFLKLVKTLWGSLICWEKLVKSISPNVNNIKIRTQTAAERDKTYYGTKLLKIGTSASRTNIQREISCSASCTNIQREISWCDPTLPKWGLGIGDGQDKRRKIFSLFPRLHQLTPTY